MPWARPVRPCSTSTCWRVSGCRRSSSSARWPPSARRRGGGSPLSRRLAATEAKERDVVVVDDGIATGGTVAAAAALLRAQAPRRLVLAVPVAPAEGLARVRGAFDDVVCLHTPEPYFAVGQWYVDFHQVSDDQVRAALAAAGA